MCVCLFLSVCARMCEPKRTDERTHINTHINPPPQPTYTYTNHHYHPRTPHTHGNSVFVKTGRGMRCMQITRHH